MAVSSINEFELRKAIQQLKPDGQVFEVRIIQSKKVLSGYFRDADTLLKALGTVDLRGANVYLTLNKVNDALFARQQSERFLAGMQSTNDKDIEGYCWLFIDLDPVRASGISASDQELKAATDLARKIYAYLHDLGFAEPVKALSGNGAHLLYSIGLARNDENEALVKNCLEALALMFDTDAVKVDVSNYNPARVCKLYGTLAQKGTSTQDRPHRPARILGDIKDVKQVDKVYLQKLAEQVPKPEPVKPASYNNYQPSEFDIEDWMGKHGIQYSKGEWQGATRYVLSECPFDHSHKAPDSMILKQPSGAIGFKCLHNSCQGKTWHDVRVMFEPDAYERKVMQYEEYENGYKKHVANRERENLSYDGLQDKPEAPAFRNVQAILELPHEDEEFIKTGVFELDKAIRGLAKGKVSLLTGLRGAAKSTFLNMLVLAAREQGYNSLVYSGELTNRNFVKWLMLQAAGEDFVYESSSWPGYYNVVPEAQPKIASWMGDHVMIYNNDYGNKFALLHSLLIEQITSTKADLVILDNLMSLNIAELSKDKYEAQTAFINVLCELAQKTKTHILFVAHPRKAQGFLRLDDVSGSADLSNRVDYAFIIHRNNNDFKRLSLQMFPGFKETDYMYQGTNVIEVVKDRDGGTQDKFIPLWYDPRTKRLKNTETEKYIYAWDKRETAAWTSVDEKQMQLPF